MTSNHKTNNLISKKNALKITLGMLIIIVLFHVAILMHYIPYTIVWAGKLKTVDEVLFFEITSIILNLFLLAILVLKGDYFKHKVSDKILNVILWLFVALFTINTIGNLLAQTMVEKIVFAPLTFILAILVWDNPKKRKIKKRKIKTIFLMN